MRLIDAAVAAADSIWFGRIGDFEIQVHRLYLSNHPRALVRGYSLQHKHAPLRIADPFIMIAHVIGSLWEKGRYLATATNVIDHAIERSVLPIDWIVRVHEAFLGWHLIGTRLAMSHRCLGQRLLVYVHQLRRGWISQTTRLRRDGYVGL